MSLLRLFFLLCFFSLLSFSVFSQPFKLLKDINTGVSGSCLGNPKEPMNLTELNGQLFFSIWGGSGTVPGLYKTDGTPAGTTLVTGLAGIDKIVKTSTTLFMTVNSSPQLWKSDGTETGTTLLNVSATRLLAINDILYFTSDAGGLWKSDGTIAGTVLVKSVSGIQNFCDVNGTLFFTSGNGALWKSDGTEAGTVLVTNQFDPYSYLDGVLVLNGELYLIAKYWSLGVFEVWKSNGTAAGTTKIKTIDTGATFNSTRNLTALNGAIYFFANTATNGTALWRTDGTDPGTYEVKALDASSFPQELFAYNGQLFFSSYDAVNGGELWRSDGTAAGTQIMKDINPGFTDLYPNGSEPAGFFNFSGTLYFTASNEVRPTGSYGCGDFVGELWKSDGTAAGTVLVKDIFQGGAGSGPSGFTTVNGTLFFVATDGLSGREIWKCDGTANGTNIVKDLTSSGGSNPKSFVMANGIPYFIARDPRSGPSFLFGEELYMTDGIVSNTLQLGKIIALGESVPRDAIAFKNQVFFAASDNTSRPLWRNDGTHRGTFKVKDIDILNLSVLPEGNHSKFSIVNNELFFAATNRTQGMELWKTDGTETGTVQVKDINTGGSSNPINLTEVNGTLYFVADDGASGLELWKSNGTETGTVIVKNINAGSNSSNPRYLTALNGLLYFTADDGANGIELWKSDGTEAGTVMVKNISTGVNSSSPALLRNINNVLYFSADDGVNGIELWKSDGTEAGTVLIQDIYQGSTGSNPGPFVGIDGGITFAADNGITGRELWKSNGSSAGTVLVKDILAGSTGSNPSALTKIGENILFAANDGIHGNETWLTNGFEQATRMMSEIEPGPGSSDPTEFFEWGAKMLVSATNSMVGSEVWIADVPASSTLPLQLLEFKGSVVNNDGVLQWKTDNESNTAFFGIERSVDGRNFISIGKVTSANAPGVHLYDYTDLNIKALGSNNFYYRLKQTDIDGRYTYSNIVILSAASLNRSIVLQPNPVKEKINLRITVSRQTKMQWELVDYSGRSIMAGNANLSSGSNTLTVDAAHLSSGIYFMRINNLSSSEVVKIIKQ